MSIRTRILAASLAASALTGAAIAAPVTAYAAPARSSHVNVLAHWCAGVQGWGDVKYTRDCVVSTDDGYLNVRDHAGRYVAVGDGASRRDRGPAAILRWAKAHSVPCEQEDSARCYWDAGRGNGRGHSFVVIGGRAEGEGTVMYIS